MRFVFFGGHDNLVFPLQGNNETFCSGDNENEDDVGGDPGGDCCGEVHGDDAVPSPCGDDTVGLFSLPGSTQTFFTVFSSSY